MTKSKISTANETDFIHYSMASKAEKKETTSESIKMLIDMIGDDTDRLQGGIE